MGPSRATVVTVGEIVVTERRPHRIAMTLDQIRGELGAVRACRCELEIDRVLANIVTPTGTLGRGFIGYAAGTEQARRDKELRWELHACALFKSRADVAPHFSAESAPAVPARTMSRQND